MKTPMESPEPLEPTVRKNVPVRTASVTSRLTGMLTYGTNSPDGGYSTNQLKESYIEIENMCCQLANKRTLCEKRLQAKNEKIAMFTSLHGSSQHRMLQAVTEATYKAKLRNKALVERMGDMKDAISHVVGDVATDNGLHRAQEAYKSKLTIALPAHISALAIRESFLSQSHMQLPQEEAPLEPGNAAGKAHLAGHDAEQLFQRAHNRAMGWANDQKQSQLQQKKQRQRQDLNQTGISSASSSSRSHSHVDSDASTVVFGIKSLSLNNGNANSSNQSHTSRSQTSMTSSNNEDSNMFVYSDSDQNGNSSSSHISQPSHSSSSSSGNGTRNQTNSGRKHSNEANKSYSLLTSEQTDMSVSNINSDSNASKTANNMSVSENVSVSRSLRLAESDEESSYGNGDSTGSPKEDIDINDTGRKVADATLESSLYFAFTVTGGSPSYKVPSSPGGFRAGSSSPGSAARIGQRQGSPVARLTSPSVRASPSTYGATYSAPLAQTTSAAAAESSDYRAGGGGGAVGGEGTNRSKTAEFSNLFDEDEFEDEDVIRSAPALVDLETTMNSNR